MKKLLILLSLLLCAACLFTAASAADILYLSYYQEVVDLAYSLEDGAKLPEPQYLYGRVISIDAPYSYKYNNITVTIAVEGREDKPIYCYRLAGPGAPEIRVGSKISVKGTLKNYNGTIEFDKGCQLLSTHAEVQPFTTLELEASFDKTSVAVGENVTLSFTTIQDCVTGHQFTVVQRIYDEQNETCYQTTCAFFPVYGG